MKKLYIICLAVMVAVSCHERPLDQTQHLGNGEMLFNVKAPGPQTKVTADAFEISDVVGLYVTDYVNESTPMPLQISGNRANNMVVAFDGINWTPERSIYWGDGKSDVYAYYPYISEIEDVNYQFVAVSTNQNAKGGEDVLGGYEASDFLWAKASGMSQTEGTINLAMSHLMSKLTVKIVAGEDYVGSLPEDATVELHSTVTGARIDLETGSVVKDPYSGAKSIRMRKLGLRSYDGVQAVVYEAIVVPQMLETSVPLLEINSKSVSYLLEDSFNFRSGVAYTYVATLNTSTTAIKVEIDCELEDWNNAGGEDSGDSSAGGGSEDGGEEDSTVYTDLSATGTANCYLVQQSGDYKFKAVIGNSDATVGNVKSVEVLWESFGTDEMPNVGDLIAAVSYKNGYVCFSTPETFRDGNAVIAAKNSKGIILWSWHIWCAEEGWQEQVYYNNAGTMMDRNLGAISATPGNIGALGLLYQWGRKDPFMGLSSISSSTLAVSTGIWNITSGGSAVSAELNPMTFYTNLGLSNSRWETIKTFYDPCPAGWRVPEGGVWAKALGADSSASSDYDYINDGCNFSGSFGDAETIWYPNSGYRTYTGGISSIGKGRYFSCSQTQNGNIYVLYGSTINDVAYNYSHKYEGLPVRCQKE